MSGKLKGVYDAFDHGQYKQALKLLTAFLKKEPKHSLAKALNAMALERCGKKDEAIKVALDAQQSGLDDDTVLNNIKVVYRRCRRFDLLVKMWDAAWTKDPSNDQIGERLYLASLRDKDFVKAQQVATKLYSKLKREQFLHWIIVSLHLQSRLDENEKALQLAGMMLMKAPVQPPADSEAPFHRGRMMTVLMHLETLRMQQKYPEALELLDKSKDIVKYDSDISSMKTRLLLEADKFAEATFVAGSRWAKAPSDWGRAQEFIRLAFQSPEPPALKRRRIGDVEVVDHVARLTDAGDAPAVCPTDDESSFLSRDPVSNAALMLRYLQSKNAEQGSKTGVTQRVQHLASLELRRAAFAAAEEAFLQAATAGASSTDPSEAWRSSIDDSEFTAFVEDVKDFLKQFAGKPHAFFDLKPFLSIIPDSHLEDLLVAARSNPSADEERSKAELSRLEARLRRALLRGSRDSAELVTEVRRLLSLKSGDAALPSEEFMLLAIVTLMDLDKQTSGSAGRPYIFDAITLAEMGIAEYPQAFNFKVLLVLMYSSLGLPGPMLKWYSQLEVKNSQHESISYLAFEMLCRTGPSDLLKMVAGSILHFHEDMDRDGDEGVYNAFSGSSLHRATEYLEALWVGQRSLQWARAVVDESLAEVGQAQTWETLLDNLAKHPFFFQHIQGCEPEHWDRRNQDRLLLNALNPLPLTSPSGISSFSSQAWRSGDAVPTLSLQGHPTAAVCSAAPIWRTAKKAEVKVPQYSRSAAEELLYRGSDFPAARTKMFAAMLSLLSSALAESANAAEVSSALEAVTAAATRLSLKEESPADRCLKLAMVACEATNETLRCCSAEGDWAQVEQRLTHLNEKIPAIVKEIELGSQFDISTREALEFIWTFLHSCASIVVPVAAWMTTALPKVGKKAKEGSEQLVQTRATLKTLLGTLQTTLADLQLSLASASAKMALDGETSGESVLEALGSEAQELRMKLVKQSLEAYRGHLQKLQDSIAARISLLKSRGPFKP